jgi:hypothetical protein
MSIGLSHRHGLVGVAGAGPHGSVLLDHRLAAYSEEQRLVLGANTYRQFVLGPSTEAEKLDPLNARMRTMPLTVVSSTLEGPSTWPSSTVESGDAVDIVARLKRSPRCRCALTAACR